MATIIRWFQNATDPNPVETEFHPEHEWPGGQGIVGETQAIIDIGFMQRYGVASPDGVSRIMFGWGEGQGNYGHEIAKALKDGRKVTHQELRDLVATRATRFEGFTHDDYIRLVGRPDPDASNEAPGSSTSSPIFVDRPDLIFGFAWWGSGPRGGTAYRNLPLPGDKFYMNESKARPAPIIKQPLGTGESGGETVTKPEQTLSVQGRLELIERQLAELLAMLRKGNP